MEMGVAREENAEECAIDEVRPGEPQGTVREAHLAQHGLGEHVDESDEERVCDRHTEPDPGRGEPRHLERKQEPLARSLRGCRVGGHDHETTTRADGDPAVVTLDGAG